jgi:hypothetical protein
MTKEVSPEGDTGKQVVPTPDLAAAFTMKSACLLSLRERKSRHWLIKPWY